MKAIHKKRLRKLIAFLRQLPRKRFNFDTIRYGHGCGTVGCAIGWTPEALPSLVKNDSLLGPVLRKGNGYFRDIAAELTGLGPHLASCLFCPGEQAIADSRLPNLPATATPKQVARMLEKFIELQEAK